MFEFCGSEFYENGPFVINGPLFVVPSIPQGPRSLDGLISTSQVTVDDDVFVVVTIADTSLSTVTESLVTNMSTRHFALKPCTSICDACNNDGLYLGGRKGRKDKRGRREIKLEEGREGELRTIAAGKGWVWRKKEKKGKEEGGDKRRCIVWHGRFSAIRQIHFWIRVTKMCMVDILHMDATIANQTRSLHAYSY